MKVLPKIEPMKLSAVPEPLVVGPFEILAALQFEKSYWSEGKAKSNPL